MSFLSLIVKLGGDNSGFKNSLKEGELAVAGFGRRLNRMLGGMFSVAALTTATKKLIDYGSKIDDASKRLGISRRALQEFDYWATQNGATLDDVTSALSRLSVARSDALEKTGEARDAFKAFGLGVAELKAMSLEQIFKRIAETMRTTDFGADTEDLLRTLMGRGAGGLGSAFAESLTEAADELQRIKGLLADDIVILLDKAGDAVDKMAFAVRGPLGTGFAFIANRVREIVDLLSIGLGGVGGFLGNIWANAKDVWNDKIPITGAEVARIFKDAPKAFMQGVDDALDDIIKRDAPKPAVPPRVKKIIEHADAKAEAAERERIKRMEADTREGSLNPYANTGDSLSRLGIYLSGGQNPQVNLVKESNKLLLEIARNTRPTAQQRDIFQ